MRAYSKEIVLSTSRKYEIIDITREVERIVRDSRIKNGLCLVYAPHATAAIIANENESGLKEDILRKIREDYPEKANWMHNLIDDNASAHLASAFIASSRIFPIVNGSLYRGTWQNIFLVELDGPRSIRKVLIHILGE